MALPIEVVLRANFKQHVHSYHSGVCSNERETFALNLTNSNGIWRMQIDVT